MIAHVATAFCQLQTSQLAKLETRTRLVSLLAKKPTPTLLTSSFPSISHNKTLQIAGPLYRLQPQERNY